MNEDLYKNIECSLADICRRFQISKDSLLDTIKARYYAEKDIS